MKRPTAGMPWIWTYRTTLPYQLTPQCRDEYCESIYWTVRYVDDFPYVRRENLSYRVREILTIISICFRGVEIRAKRRGPKWSVYCDRCCRRGELHFVVNSPHHGLAEPTVLSPPDSESL